MEEKEGWIYLFPAIEVLTAIISGLESTFRGTWVLVLSQLRRSEAWSLSCLVLILDARGRGA